MEEIPKAATGGRPGNSGNSAPCRRHHTQGLPRCVATARAYLEWRKRL